MSAVNDPEPRHRSRGPLAVLGSTLLILAVLAAAILVQQGNRRGWWRASGGERLSSPSTFRPTEAIEDTIAGWLARAWVEPARPGEALTPKIRYEQSWSQWAFLLVFVGSVSLIIWLYRREGSAPVGYKALLASLRIALVLLAMFLLSEAVLSVERTGLPTFVIMADDSASGQVVDEYENDKVQAEAIRLAKLADREQADRFAVGLGWLLDDDAKLVNELASQQKVKFYRISEAAVPVAEVNQPEELSEALATLKGLEPTGEQTRLGEGVRQVLEEMRGVPPTAILILSDGRTTDGPKLSEAAELARKEGVPLFTIGLGDVRPMRDLELTDLQVDEVVFVNDVVRFEARLSAQGFDVPEAGEPGSPPEVNVFLKRRRPGSNDPKDLETVETIRVPIPPEGQPRKVEISDRPTETGQVEYVLEVEPQPRELHAENNRIERAVEVRDEKLKVLFVEGEPRWEFRFLKTYLERDETIDLGVLLQSADDLYAEQDRSALPIFPSAKEGEGGLYSYDVVILGDVEPGTYLNSQNLKNLAEFVTEKGGGLILIAGQLFNPLAYQGTPLEPLMPVQLADARDPSRTGAPVDSFKPELTAEGRGHPIFRLGDDEASSLEIWESLPLSNWYLEAPREQPAAVVLAEHPEKVGPEGRLPILLYHYAGSGKVYFSAIDDTWRWRQRIGDRYFGRYWVQLVRFMARSKLVGQRQAEIVTDRRRYRRGQPIQVSVRFPNPALAQDVRSLTVDVQRQGQAARKVTLRPAPGSQAQNRFEGTLPPLAEGVYEVRLLPPPALKGDLPTTRFQIDPPAGEFVQVAMDREDLAAAAQESGGHFFRWDEVSQPTPLAESVSTDSVSMAPTGPSEKSLRELLPAPQQVPLDTDPPIPLWNTWLIYGLFLALISLEWVLRKRKQMV